MRFGKFELNFGRIKQFSDGTSLTKSDLTKEVGISGTSNMFLYKEEELNTDTIKISDYRKMRQNDGTVNSLYSILTLPIMATPWHIKPDDEDTTGEQSDFVNSNFRLPAHQGGMSVPFSLVLADMLRATLEGFRLFEKVWTINPDGKLVYKKLAPRDADTLFLRRDANGSFDGARQRCYYHGEWFDVIIPVEKCFLFTFQKDKNYLYGESAFKSAYYHYDRKHKLYYLANLAVQVGALPPRTLHIPENASKDEREKAEKAADSLGVRQRITLPEGYTLDWANFKQGSIDPLPLIQHHNEEMARSILAQFIMMGTGGNSGSYALSKNHSDILVMAIKGLMMSIEEHINSFIIPDLIEYNFPNPIYPTFEFDEITDSTQELIKDAFLTLIKKGQLSDWLVQDLEKKIAQGLDIEVPDDIDAINEQKRIDAETAKKNADTLTQAKIDAAKNGVDPNAVDPNAPVVPPVNDKSKGVKPMLDDVASVPVPDFSTMWRRPLTSAEQVVRFTDIQAKMDTMESTFAGRAKDIFDQLRNGLVQNLTVILSKGTVTNDQIDAIALNNDDVNAYKQLIVSTMKDGLQYGKQAAAGELRVKIPAVNQNTSTFITQQAQTIVDRQTTDLLTQVKFDVLSQLRKNTLSEVKLDLSDIIGKIIGNFDNYFPKVTLTGAIVVAQSINRGRDDVFSASSSDIAVYQYSAILDHNTCSTCEELDNSVIDQAEYDSTDNMPPIHDNCRCIWVAINKDQTEIPELTGFPDDTGDTSLHDHTKKIEELQDVIKKKDRKFNKLKQVIVDEAIEAEIAKFDDESGDEDDEGK